MKSFVTLPSSSLIALLLIIAIDPIVISSGRASQPLPSPTFNIFKRDFQACCHRQPNQSQTSSNSNLSMTSQCKKTSERKQKIQKVADGRGLSTGRTSEDPGQTVGLDNGCKKSPETDRSGQIA
ncbi:hypothetical protein PPACK8108_LOCUS25038 [Phakopsora pachyrhizi]|uniref:Secreted protein n=1 Tax=Phakopsora pachyrhizi TaxID=170000 RepID=A0AAV0BT35_PHAPC|nr:hypothetical protein PPACK8108_LOCUS25038 [Phakopsora pachyrhizi]